MKIGTMSLIAVVTSLIVFALPLSLGLNTGPDGTDYNSGDRCGTGSWGAKRDTYLPATYKNCSTESSESERKCCMRYQVASSGWFGGKRKRFVTTCRSGCECESGKHGYDICHYDTCSGSQSCTKLLSELFSGSSRVQPFVTAMFLNFLLSAIYRVLENEL